MLEEEKFRGSTIFGSHKCLGVKKFLEVEKFVGYKHLGIRKFWEINIFLQSTFFVVKKMLGKITVYALNPTEQSHLNFDLDLDR
jgi:hypothetical protein